MKELSIEEFVLRAIIKLRLEGHKGIHSRYNHFNIAFKAYFPNKDPVAEILSLESRGIVAIRQSHNGVILYIPEEAPPDEELRYKAIDALRRMGLEVSNDTSVR